MTRERLNFLLFAVPLLPGDLSSPERLDSYSKFLFLLWAKASIQQAAKKIGKSEKTIRRWIQDGKLQAENRGGGYLIKREDLAALTKHVTKEWQEQSDLSHIKLLLAILEGQVEQLKIIADAQQYEIETLQSQVKKLTPKKPAPRKKTSSTRTTKRKRDDDLW